MYRFTLVFISNAKVIPWLSIVLSGLLFFQWSGQPSIVLSGLLFLGWSGWLLIPYSRLVIQQKVCVKIGLLGSRRKFDIICLTLTSMLITTSHDDIGTNVGQI